MSVEKYLIGNCSPTLASIKTANLFTIPCKDEKELERQLRFWNEKLKTKGITLYLLRKSASNALVYVCRKKQLQEDLKRPGVLRFLMNYGYQDSNVDHAIAHLAERVREGKGFPHEIGIFLNYPLGDVIGFIRNAGQNYKCRGCWKVYCNACETSKVFEKYHKCRRIYQKLWSEGKSVMQLTVAA